MSLSYLRNLNGYYYFRTRIPCDLLHYFNYPEIQKSLKTKKLSVAKAHSKVLASNAELLFAQIRSGLLEDQQIYQLTEKYFPSRKNNPKYTVKPRMLSQVIAAYVEEHIAMDKWQEKTRREVTSALSLAIRVIGDVHLGSIDRVVMVDYLNSLKRLPSNLNKHSRYRELSIKQLLDMDIQNPMSQRTINKYITRVSSLFIWCMRQEYMNWNPAAALTNPINAKEEEERKAYSLEDIEKAITMLRKYKNVAPERYFVPLIAMYSGARLNEICQLRVSDIKEIDGVLCFDINDDDDKRIKNKASRRIVPVHPDLEQLGFMDHVAKMHVAGHPRLWMNLKLKRDGYGHDFSKWFGRYNRRHITEDPKKVFHSFRHLFADTLKQKGVAEGVIAEILGHTNPSITTGRYGKRYRPQVLLDALNELNIF